jgi:hypothetical protein
MCKPVPYASMDGQPAAAMLYQKRLVINISL